jgi:hypothetical protein
MEEIDAARDSQERHQLNARWNIRAHGEQVVLNRSEEALRVGERIAIYARSIARALMDGSADAQPMPGVSAVLVGTASATDAFAACVASGDKETQLRILSETVRSMDDSLDSVVAGLEELTGIEAASWLTFGAVLTINHWILSELGQASRLPANSTRDFAGRNGPTGATV